jgi:hypothetical protein
MKNSFGRSDTPQDEKTDEKPMIAVKSTIGSEIPSTPME